VNAYRDALQPADVSLDQRDMLEVAAADLAEDDYAEGPMAGREFRF
jgi:hypothetical protein